MRAKNFRFLEHISPSPKISFCSSDFVAHNIVQKFVECSYLFVTINMKLCWKLHEISLKIAWNFLKSSEIFVNIPWYFLPAISREFLRLFLVAQRSKRPNIDFGRTPRSKAPFGRTTVKKTDSWFPAVMRQKKVKNPGEKLSEPLA